MFLRSRCLFLHTHHQCFLIRLIFSVIFYHFLYLKRIIFMLKKEILMMNLVKKFTYRRKQQYDRFPLIFFLTFLSLLLQFCQEFLRYLHLLTTLKLHLRPRYHLKKIFNHILIFQLYFI